MTGSPKSQHRLFWAALAAPGIIWLALLFIVPFYAILAIAGGQLDIFGNPVAVWNPLHWSPANFTLPLSKQAILTGMLITVLPMLGDYFTKGSPGST